MHKYSGKDEYEKEFLSIFDELARTSSGWQVWENIITAMACSISNAADHSKIHLKQREKEYERAIKALGDRKKAVRMLALVVMALEKNPEQDFLGTMYMMRNLGNHWKGQFFTPYHICHFMAEITMMEPDREALEKKGYFSVADPCVGGGAMMIAGANVMKNRGVDYKSRVLFVGQDIDRIVAMMAYIQLSILDCPGYIVVGDSLCNPMTGHELFPQEKEGLDIWYTPMFMSKVWYDRRRALIESMAEETDSSAEKKGAGIGEDYAEMKKTA